PCRYPWTPTSRPCCAGCWTLRCPSRRSTTSGRPSGTSRTGRRYPMIMNGEASARSRSANGERACRRPGDRRRLGIRTVYRPLRPAIADLAGWQSGSGRPALALAEGGNLMGSVKWAAVLVAVVISALDALANLLLAFLTPHAVPVVVNLFAL